MSKSIFFAPHFNDEAAAYAYVEARVWPNGRVCPHCGVVDKSGALKGKTNRPGLYKCYACRKPFTVKVGTIFEASHIQLRDWLAAIHLICSSKKGISANQLHRTLGITLKSAWFMAHRIRAAMDPWHDGPITPDMGGPGKIIEMDETVLARSTKTKKRPGQKNIKIMALVERGGAVRSFPLPRVDTRTLKFVVDANVRKESRYYTDGLLSYRDNAMGLEGGHEWVDHSTEEYARGDVHVNTAEGIFSLFKRGMVGTYQHCGEQHLHRYLAEFDFRASNRKALGIEDVERSEIALKGIAGKRLTYKTTRQEVSE
jgi:transposase-like protein